MAHYRKGSHTVFDNKFHVVWTTKYRYRVLSAKIAQRTRDLIRQICRELDVLIVKGHLSSDHVHMLVSLPPQVSVSKFVQHVKGKSSRKLQMDFKELRQRYWGKHIWARGYFCATTGVVTEDQIKQYIENHHEDENEDFTIEGR
jgi:putative transposase